MFQITTPDEALFVMVPEERSHREELARELEVKVSELPTFGCIQVEHGDPLALGDLKASLDYLEIIYADGT